MKIKKIDVDWICPEPKDVDAIAEYLFFTDLNVNAMDLTNRNLTVHLIAEDKLKKVQSIYSKDHNLAFTTEDGKVYAADFDEAFEFFL